MKLHMDGARFANALAFLGCAPADVSWRAGVDALSFGFTKNGAMTAEAIVFFGGSGGAGVREIKKRGGSSEEHTSELQSIMRKSYAGFCLIKKKNIKAKV